MSMQSSSAVKIRPDSLNRFEQRRHRFANDAEQRSKPIDSSSNAVIIGTCDTLEKDYFRLTSAPDPSKIRPLAILQKAFDYVMNKYRSNHDWFYLNNQLKSIRQDLMVQSIRNDFAVLVYEENARVALEMKDREQFVQCQSQLDILYDSGADRTHYNEFLMYRLLYSFLVNDYKKCNGILIEIEEIVEKENGNVDLRTSVDFCLAFRRKDFFRFFLLYQLLPILAQSLVDIFLDFYRKQTVRTLVWGYSPSLPLPLLTQVLAYQSDEICRDFLRSLGIVFLDESENVDCKRSRMLFDQRK